MVLTTHLREYPSSGRIFKSPAGDSKGGQASPFVSSRKRGARGRNPIERVSPPVRLFGYFLSVQKVTRVRAGKAREVPNRMAPIRKKNLSPPPATTQRGLAPFGFPHIREETCPELLRILPMLHLKNPVSTSTNRNISPFNRAVAEASLTTKPHIRCQNEIQWQRCPKSDKDRLGKNTGTGVSPAIFGDFLSLKSHPGPGRGGPEAIE